MDEPAVDMPESVRAHPGDRLELHPVAQGEPARRGEILDVLGEGGQPPFVVRWEGAGEDCGLVYPGPGATVRRGDRHAS